jgi:exoribonuclease-2
MKVPVKLVNTDSVHGFIDFEFTQGIESAKEDRLARKRAAALVLRDRIGETFRAAVSGTSRKATWLKIIPGDIEGRLVRGRRGLSVGDEIAVVLLAVDPARGFIDFAREDTVLPVG